MKSRALCDVACELNRTHTIDFIAIMVGFKQQLTEATEAEAYAYLETAVRLRLVEFFKVLRRRGCLSGNEHARHKDRCLWLFAQISKTTAPLEYSSALCEHVRELQNMMSASDG